jgi:hypothetical protein
MSMNRLYAIVLALGMAWTSSGLAADAAGVVKTRRGEAHVERDGQRVPLDPGIAVFQGDRVLTGPTGYIGITMHDDTLLTLGPNALLVVDTYAFDTRTQDGNFIITLTRGALSVVTGLIAKRSPESFVVKTRLSTMGVRGTEFIVEAYEQ